MAKWKPGETGNAGGRPKLPEDLQRVKRITADEVKQMFSRFGRMTNEEAQVCLADPKTTVLELAILKSLIDSDKLPFALDRMVGRLREEIEITIPAPTVVRRFSSNEVVVLGVDVKALPEGSED